MLATTPYYREDKLLNRTEGVEYGSLKISVTKNVIRRTGPPLRRTLKKLLPLLSELSAYP